jgi:hypothetical protein
MSKFNSFPDILVASGLTEDQFAEQIKNDSPDEAAYKKLKLITKAYNGDWAPDFSNDDQVKYENLFYHNGTEFVFDLVDDWYAYSDVGSRLCFGSREDAKEAATIFIKEYREFLS